MSEQPKKPHEMTTHEAMEHLFTSEGAEHAKRIVREHDEPEADHEEETENNEPSM